MFTVIYAYILATAVASVLFLALGAHMTRQQPDSTTTSAPVAPVQKAA